MLNAIGLDGDHHDVPRRSSTGCARYFDAAAEVSLARRSSLNHAVDTFTWVFSAVVVPDR